MAHIRMITQVPSEGYDWLYEDREDDYRYFTDVVYRPEGTEPWAECTNAEKEAWEESHKPEEPQIEEAEVVNA